MWLFSANKIKISEYVSKQPSQLIIELNSSLRQKLGTLEFFLVKYFSLQLNIFRHAYQTVECENF
jgi:hypothetical protein